MITLETLTAARSSIDKLVAQGNTLFQDITETAQDRARLIDEAEQREQVIDRLNKEVQDLTTRCEDVEARNDRLADDVTRLESQLSDATARLSAISETCRFDFDAVRNVGSSGHAGNGSDAGNIDNIRPMQQRRPELVRVEEQ